MRRAFRLAPYVEKTFNEVSTSQIKVQLIMPQNKLTKLQEYLEKERIKLDQRVSVRLF